MIMLKRHVFCMGFEHDDRTPYEFIHGFRNSSKRRAPLSDACLGMHRTGEATPESPTLAAAADAAKRAPTHRVLRALLSFGLIEPLPWQTENMLRPQTPYEFIGVFRSYVQQTI